MIPNVLIFVAIIILSFVGIFYLAAFKTKRAIRRVVEIFRQQDALTSNRAKTIDELGLRRPDFVQRLMKGRDYKQFALQALIKQGIVQVTEDGRLYLVEEKLGETFSNKPAFPSP